MEETHNNRHGLFEGTSRHVHVGEFCSSWEALFNIFMLTVLKRSVTRIYDAACPGAFPRPGGIYHVRPSTDAEVSEPSIPKEFHKQEY